MNSTRKSEDIGLGQAHVICNMKAEERLKFIAEGLPIIFDSAKSFMTASRSLKESPREAEILRRNAEEECAKILILTDIIRCPKAVVMSRIGRMMRWFYHHLARLIYVEAQTWKPTSVNELQTYVDNNRRSHYLEGEFSEYIMPNWALFIRESSLYADVMCDEDSDPTWCSPVGTHTPGFLDEYDPTSYILAEGLEAIGAFTPRGLAIVHDVWGKVEFVGDMDWSPTRELFREMLDRLEAAGLITERLTELHVRMLANNWQLPMYHIEFSAIAVPLEKLREERDRHTPYY